MKDKHFISKVARLEGELNYQRSKKPKRKLKGYFNPKALEIMNMWFGILI